MNKKAKLAYQLSIASYIGLTLLMLCWITWWSPPKQWPISIVLIIATVPLLFPLRGLLHGKLYTFGWLPFLMLAYFIHGSTEAFANSEERLLALLEVFFSACLFISCTLYVKFTPTEKLHE